MSKIRTIEKEIRFAVDICEDKISAAKLIFHTILYHLQNKGVLPDLGSLHFYVNVRLGPLGIRRLRLRTFSGDLFIFYEVLLHKVYGLSPELVDPNDVKTVVDAGGNVGLSSLFFAMEYKQAEIHVIEASAENFQILLENVRGISRIRPRHAALTGTTKTSIRFSSDRKAWGNRIVPDTEDGEEVSTVTVKKVLADTNRERIDLLKIDIEGGEAEVMAHGEFIPCVKFGVIEIHPPYSLEDLERDLATWRFEVLKPSQWPGLSNFAFRAGLEQGQQN